MHECNAMQILKTKGNQNSKRGMVTKNNEMKHKDCQKDSVGLSLLHLKPFRCNSNIGVIIHIRMMSNSKIGIKV